MFDFTSNKKQLKRIASVVKKTSGSRDFTIKRTKENGLSNCAVVVRKNQGLLKVKKSIKQLL